MQACKNQHQDARKWLAVAAVGCISALACYGEIVELNPSPQPVVPGLYAPPRVNFELVADALQVGCGTLDCHGQTGRNLRLYGARGLRLDSKDNSATGVTTAAEYEANYWSLVGLEPEVLSAVIADGGEDLNRLSLVRKARGVEKHKGGSLTQTGDDLDRCLTSWLEGEVASDTCKAAAMAARPDLPDDPGEKAP